MKRIARWAVKFLMMNPELLELWLGPVLSKPKVAKALRSHGPTVRRIIRMLESTVTGD